MKPERWSQVDQLFHDALGRRPEERAAFLDEACLGDQSLRQQVEALLAGHQEAGSFMERPAMEVEARGVAAEQGRAQVGLATGETVTHYRIISPLGSGGMGDVYLAQDTVLSRQVALKLLPAHFTTDRDRLRRFQQEARAASALNHPNIITIFEIGESAGRHFIVTEFIDGQTLRDYIVGSHSHTPADGSLPSGKQLKLSEILSVAIQAADALAAAHEAGIVHRDIKPENIMARRRDSYVKVLDFGLAKLTEGTQSTVDLEGPTRTNMQTSAGVVMGTASYMSPEQARGERVDVRTDIWSLGVVLYEMVAGCAPFDRSTPSEVIALILEREPPPLARFVREVPPELERIVNKTLTKDREERYQTAKDLSVDLRRLRQQLEFEAEIERTVQPHEKSSEVNAVAKDSDQTAAATGLAATLETADAAVAHSTSRAAYVVNEIKLHKRGALILISGLVVASVVAYFSYSRYATSSKAGTIRRVAVLPFANKGGNPDMEYLSDGVSESLINSLSQLPGVTVIARFSSFTYKGKEADPQEVANALGVEGIVTGRVTQSGDNLLISVELMDARDKTQVWGQQYNRKMSDILAVQGEIAREISARLQLRLTGPDQARLTKHPTENAEAYVLYLHGYHYVYRFDPQSIKKGIEYFKQAIEKDPNYAPAYAGLAEAYYQAQSYMSPVEALPKAKEAAQRALAIDPTVADGHYALALVSVSERDWITVERELQQAIKLKPSYARAYDWYAWILAMMGRFDESFVHFKHALEIDPLSTAINTDLGQSYYWARRYDQSVEQLRKTLELDPNNSGTICALAMTYAAQGQYQQAVAELKKVTDSEHDPTNFGLLGYVYARWGKKREAQQLLNELRDRAKSNYVNPKPFWQIYAGLGEKDRAFESLLKDCHKLGAGPGASIKVDPMYDDLRSDPRFADVLRCTGLTP